MPCCVVHAVVRQTAAACVPSLAHLLGRPNDRRTLWRSTGLEVGLQLDVEMFA